MGKEQPSSKSHTFPFYPSYHSLPDHSTCAFHTASNPVDSLLFFSVFYDFFHPIVNAADGISPDIRRRILCEAVEYCHDLASRLFAMWSWLLLPHGLR